MDINQSIDPSQIQDPVLQQLVSQAQQQSQQPVQQPPQQQNLGASTPTAPQPSVTTPNSDDDTDVHPLTDLIGQAAVKSLHAKSGISPELKAFRLPIQGGPNFMARWGAAVGGHPISQYTDPIMATNQAPDQSSLPDSLQIQPIGTDSKGNPMYSMADVEKQRQQAATAFAMNQKLGMTNPNLTTVDQIKNASGGRLDDATANQLLQSFNGAVPSKILSTNLNGQRLDSMDALAQARNAMVANASLKTLLQYGGPGAAQTAAKDAVSRSTSLQRAQAIIDQIQAGGGQADQRQRTDLAMALGKSVNPTGVLTNEAMDQFLPSSYKSKFGNFMEMLTNERQPVDFSGFIPQFQDMLTRENAVNSSIVNQARQMGLSALNQLPGVSQNTVNKVVNSPTPGMQPSQPGQPPIVPQGQPQQGGKPDPATRFNQLMANGHLSKKQAYAVMHQEGY